MRGFLGRLLVSARNSEVSGTQTVFRLLLGAALISAGLGHLSWSRSEFLAQVPDWFPVDADLVVVLSGIVELLIGSALLVDKKTGDLRSDWLHSLAQDVAWLRANGTQVVLVSSGSIALGRGVLGLPNTELALEQSQAAAAVGQIRLARAYEEALSYYLKAMLKNIVQFCFRC